MCSKASDSKLRSCERKAAILDPAGGRGGVRGSEGRKQQRHPHCELKAPFHIEVKCFGLPRTLVDTDRQRTWSEDTMTHFWLHLLCNSSIQFRRQSPPRGSASTLISRVSEDSRASNVHLNQLLLRDSGSSQTERGLISTVWGYNSHRGPEDTNENYTNDPPTPPAPPPPPRPAPPTATIQLEEPWTRGGWFSRNTGP